MLTEPANTRFLGIDFDNASYDEVASTLDGLSRRSSFSYIVTPNVDHVLILQPRGDQVDERVESFRLAYESAELRICDSRILQKLARLHGVRLSVVTGSDLTAHLFHGGWFKGRKVAIIGGDAEMSLELNKRYPDVNLVQHRPPMGVLSKPEAIDAIIHYLEDEQPDYILFAIGAPQSEIIAHRCLLMGNSVGVGLCIGASIEFLLGRKSRAPRWMQRLGLEWAFRLASEPRRLWKRYLVTGPRIFCLSYQWRAR